MAHVSHRTAPQEVQHVISVLVTVPLLCVCVSMCVSRAVDTQKYPVSKSLAATFPSVSCCRGHFVSRLHTVVLCGISAQPATDRRTYARGRLAATRESIFPRWAHRCARIYANTLAVSRWRQPKTTTATTTKTTRVRLCCCSHTHTHTHLTGVWVGCKWVVRLLVWFTRKPKVRLIQSTAYENICQPSEMYSCGRIREHLGCGQGHWI